MRISISDRDHGMIQHGPGPGEIGDCWWLGEQRVSVFREGQFVQCGQPRLTKLIAIVHIPYVLPFFTRASQVSNKDINGTEASKGYTESDATPEVIADDHG